MKNVMLLLGLIFTCLITRAQSFFYIENNNPTEKSIREVLIKASQYVTQSPLASDYIIKADAGVQDGSHVLNLKMTVQDSISLKTIFQTNEDYTISVVNANTRIFLRIAISTFIDKNINQIITCAREDHQNAQMKFLKSRKDKT
jgi:phage-related tail protein